MSQSRAFAGVLFMWHRPTVLGAALLALLASATSVAEEYVPGTFGGQLSVDELGSAAYAIPIDVPPGIAGMQPELSLQYNSGGGNGTVGVGWSLGGLSVIHRCPKTPAQDGEHGSINFDARDEFCLDGQRLVNIGGREYRTQIDGFSKILSHGVQAGGGPTSWEVFTKSGQRLEFGNTAKSRLELSTAGDDGPILRWHLKTNLASVELQLSDLAFAFSGAEHGGGGGGRPDMAQAGGKKPEKLDEAITKAPGIVEGLISK